MHTIQCLRVINQSSTLNNLPMFSPGVIYVITTIDIDSIYFLNQFHVYVYMYVGVYVYGHVCTHMYIFK